MTYKRLYEFSDSQDSIAIPVNGMARHAISLCDEDDIQFIKTPFETKQCLGYMRKSGTLPKPYADHDNWIVSIFYASELNTCWRRFVCTKELMHIFDAPEARTSTAATFERQLAELANLPLWQDTSPQTKAEFKAYWMALGVLCPLSLREIFLADYTKGLLSDYDIAIRFRVPEAYVRTMMSDQFRRSIESILENGN